MKGIIPWSAIAIVRANMRRTEAVMDLREEDAWAEARALVADQRRERELLEEMEDLRQEYADEAEAAALLKAAENTEAGRMFLEHLSESVGEEWDE